MVVEVTAREVRARSEAIVEEVEGDPFHAISETPPMKEVVVFVVPTVKTRGSVEE